MRESPSRCSSAPTAPASCGATGDARTTCLPAHASSSGGPHARSASRGCTHGVHGSSRAQVPAARRRMARSDPGGAVMIEEMRMQGLGVIADAVLPLGPGFTAITGETGAGKTMGGHGTRGCCWVSAPIPARCAPALPGFGGRSLDRPRERRRGRDRRGRPGESWSPQGQATPNSTSRARLSAEGRSRASVGGRAAPAGVLSALAEELVVVHGQSEQLRLRSAAAQRDALDRFGGAPIAKALEAYAGSFVPVADTRRRDLRDHREPRPAVRKRQLDCAKPSR